MCHVLYVKRVLSLVGIHSRFLQLIQVFWLELIDLTINVIITIQLQFLAPKYNKTFKSLLKISKKKGYRWNYLP